MSEYKTLKEWNAKKGDVFYYHHPDLSRGGDRVFNAFTDHECASAVDEDGRPMLASSPYWHLVKRATPPVNYNDGKWHGWNGGDRPVHPDTVVKYMTLDGFKNEEIARYATWNKKDGFNDIVAFRVIKEHREPRGYTIDPRKNVVWYDAIDGFIHVQEVMGQ